jgi:hypothetical protein
VQAFLIDLENKPGAFADVAEKIAANGINITAVSGATCGDTGRAAIMTDNDAATRSALSEGNCSYKEYEVTETSLRNAPGSLAKAARRLADAGVNIETLLPIGMEGDDVRVAFITDNPTKAAQALSHAATIGN